MKNNKRKGFTLTELIIVIVIIGILAAVLIPSISGYIKKAKISKGEQEAREMNTILAAEAIYQDKEYFDPYEVVKLVEESNFKLESQLKEYRFWYDASENKVKYLSMEKAFTSVSAAEKSFSQDCIEALSAAHPEYRYVDQYNDALTDVVTTVRYLVSTALKKVKGNADSSSLSPNEKVQVLKNMDDLVGEASTKISKLKIDGLTSDIVKSITNYTSEFNTYNSVYVDNNQMYNRAYFASSEEELKSIVNSNANMNLQTITKDDGTSKIGVAMEMKHMVFEPETTIIPSINSVVGQLEIVVSAFTPIVIPSTVTVVSNNSFTNIIDCISIVVNDLALFDDVALSSVAKAALNVKSSNVTFITLYQGTDFTISYSNAEAKLNDGTLVTYRDTENKITSIKNVTFIDEKGVSIENTILSKYLVPSIEFKGDKIDFTKIEKYIIRRSLLNNICTYTAILIDRDLKCYKVESFGYITDIDWNIEQDFMKNNNGKIEYGSKNATINVYLPSYVYNYSNFKGAFMEVVILPQRIETRDEMTLTGTIKVFDGTALVGEAIRFYIEDGVYDAENDRYVYKKEILDLEKLVLGSSESSGNTCNQISISAISIYTGNVSYDESGNPETDKLNYLFVRNYK